MEGNPLLTKNYVAEATVTPYSLLTYGTNEGEAKVASTQKFKVLGCSDKLGQTTAGDRVDAIKPEGIAFVQLGGTVAYGDELTIDANGHAIPLASAVAGVATVFGNAEEAATVGAQIRFTWNVYEVTIL